MLAYCIHDLDPLIFRIYDNVGPRWYGLAYVLAFLFAYVVYRALVRRGYADLPLNESRRFHHSLRPVWRDRRRPAWLRFFVQTGDVARAVVDLCAFGKAECRATAACIGRSAVHILFRTPSQSFLDESRR